VALVINSNIASLNAQRQLSSSQNSLDTTMERLASGKRINSAGDDAAGLAISNRMTSQIRGLDQAVRNANDGISMIQTAEGALSESTNILQRMRELSIQSANGIYSNEDRASLQAEVDQMKSELTRIAETTSFNGQKILDGSLGEIGLQVGSEANETIALNMGSGFDAASLGASEGGVSSGTFTLAQTDPSTAQTGTPGSLEALSAGDLTINGVDVPAAKTGSDTVSTSDNASSAIAVADAINSVADETGVVAEANATSVSIALGADSTATTIAAGDLVINNVDLAGTAVTGNAGLAAHINSFADETGVTAEVTGSGATASLVLTAADGRNIELQSDGDVTGITNLSAATSSIDSVTTGTVTLRSNEAIDIAGNDPAAAGLTAGAVTASTTEALEPTTGETLTFTLSSVTGAYSTTDGDFVLNGENINYVNSPTAGAVGTATSITNILAAINAVSGTTGVSATSNAVGEVTLTAIPGGSITIESDATGSSQSDVINLGAGADLLNDLVSETIEGVATSPFTAMTNGDLTVNGFTVDFEGTTATAANEQSAVGGDASAQFTALAINNTDGLKDQVVATAYTEANLGKVIGGDADDAFSLVINGLEVDIDNPIADGDANGNIAGTLNAAFADIANTDATNDAAGLLASINDAGELIITADDGRNITVAVGVTANTETLLSGFDVTESNAVTAKGTVSLEAKDGFSVGEIGGDKRSLAGIESGGDSVADIDITTAAGAQSAIDVLDRAIETIGSARGDLGAVNNRLDFTISNLSSVSENASAARSRIVDADFAKETANLSRAQVLQQASQAMLAQANARPQQVLSLLQ